MHVRIANSTLEEDGTWQYADAVSSDARSHGLTPFSVYQGKWNAAYRDMEAEIIPMCEDQGMAIVSWASLAGGQLMSVEEREAKKKDPDAHKGYGFRQVDIKVSVALEKIAESKNTSIQAVVSDRKCFVSRTSPCILSIPAGTCIPAPPVDLCLPNRRSTNGRTCQSVARCVTD